MCEMLWEPIVATDWEEHASETAVRYSSLSAASWALRFCSRSHNVEFNLLTNDQT